MKILACLLAGLMWLQQATASQKKTSAKVSKADKAHSRARKLSGTFYNDKTKAVKYLQDIHSLRGEKGALPFLKPLLKRLKRGENVLELGSGPGIEFSEIVKQGFNATAVDISAHMNEMVSKDIGSKQHSSPWRMITESIETFEPNDHLGVPKSFALIVANASFIHLAPDELASTLIKYKKMLKSGGLMYVSFKGGEPGQLRVDNEGRPFTDMDEDGLKKLAKEASFEIDSIETTGDVLARGGTYWIAAVFKN